MKSDMAELEQALEALGAKAECVGTSGFTRREDVLLAAASPETAKLVKGADLEVLEAMTAPTVDGQPSLPKRSAPKGLLPSTWLARTLKVAYTDCYGSGQETSGTLLDFYPAGPILNVAGAKTMISWDRLVLCELVED